ncbi:UDP-N-acetylmuramate--alanine ligase [Clostridium saccharoperbutylacetonicum]|uniref:UDP-N-acetylmuramate--L-alanine ligase n=1 Tax=Clostridium saccharoperbutylacetonicum N1-4(HMT) TaxID=931276 RepID=M1MG32_9CLOT|nr:UDP-N-acetylmuramate--L-alanine ligase [Clostridium saccharoperbutylacetonicum]AGF53936.1 UDP-N-acetylmuramate--L-alanine ligase MurC [Clostridium saccharoperbutylacetonicum N1-4(HMT)]NRT59551.1 UDP-N-acetylmuramate--alanine ligase [Clostridium saccharoperbutylacetonicum]NSB28743.1 UDP-N-acetylmuramate--alanine ligase [Clostridium saccharoperbutylacetonicum]NSB42234.1 UDP-N-acetylmuramate--alanine ligase [Clostridium saccharoperbutylacetonicum]
MSFNFIKDKNKKIHFIGIGGISMSGLAAVLLNNGFKVSGSDFKDSPILDKLKTLGAEVYIGHKRENIKDADLVVYTAAIPSDNLELLEAQEKNITLMDRAEFLGQIMKGHKYNVAITGTHGKTTCTSMLSHITLAGDLDPTILVGGELDAIGGNFRIGKSDYFLVEACEYKRSFLKFFPYVGIILNIDADHLDCYKDIDEIADTFLKFSKLIPNDGYLVGCIDDFRVKEILSKANCNTISYGFSDNADVTAKNITFNKNGCATFDVYKGNKNLFTLTLNVPGKHNILNALASTCVSLIFDISADSIIDGLSKCKGAHKRFEYKGELNGVTVIDDYAHHPTEIQATLSTAKQIDHNKTYCIFQPHTYTRTKALFTEFTECFNDVDELILMDIYAAREKNTGLVSSDELGDALRKKGIKCTNVHSHDEALNYVKSKLTDGDLLLTVGAGDVVIVGEKYLES